MSDVELLLREAIMKGTDSPAPADVPVPATLRG